jgi:phosphinothricin acetyltransferase
MMDQTHTVSDQRPCSIRLARPRDAAACAAIYAPYVLDGPASFEDVPPSPRQMRARFRYAHAWLVAERDGRVVGFAYGAPHRERAAYRWSADVSVYLDAAHHRQGIGRALYVDLFERLRTIGIRMLCAGITQPNEASNGLHAALGFTPVGTYQKIGWKQGRWHDVLWMQLDLWRDGGEGPPSGHPAAG